MLEKPCPMLIYGIYPQAHSCLFIPSSFNSFVVLQIFDTRFLRKLSEANKLARVRTSERIKIKKNVSKRSRNNMLTLLYKHVSGNSVFYSSSFGGWQKIGPLMKTIYQRSMLERHREIQRELSLEKLH